MASKIIVTQKRSTIHQCQATRRIMQALGLRKMNTSRTHKDNNCIRGMINKVKHLVDYKLVSE